jgi:hypothetical protein
MCSIIRTLKIGQQIGYDPDSRSAEKVCQACLKIALELRNGLGESNLARLREATQDIKNRRRKNDRLSDKTDVKWTWQKPSVQRVAKLCRETESHWIQVEMGFATAFKEQQTNVEHC